MCKLHNLVFGDVVKNVTTDIHYVAVSIAMGMRAKKSFVTFLKISKDLNCLGPQLFPFDRNCVKEFELVKNVAPHIESYLKVFSVIYDKGRLKEGTFTVKKNK